MIAANAFADTRVCPPACRVGHAATERLSARSMLECVGAHASTGVPGAASALGWSGVRHAGILPAPACYRKRFCNYSPGRLGFLIGTINLIVLSSPGTISMFTPACVDCPLVRLVGRFCQYTYPGGPRFARTITVAKPNTVAIRITAASGF